MTAPIIITICTAYESGMGHGLKRDGACNPYRPGSDEAVAYQLGYDEGVDRAGAEALTQPTSAGDA